jgi:hypothetical protein
MSSMTPTLNFGQDRDNSIAFGGYARRVPAAIFEAGPLNHLSFQTFDVVCVALKEAKHVIE